MEHFISFFFLLTCLLVWTLTKAGLQKEDDESNWITNITKPIFKNKLLKFCLGIIWLAFFAIGFYFFIRFVYLGGSGIYEELKQEATTGFEFWLFCLSIVTFIATSASRIKIRK